MDFHRFIRNAVYKKPWAGSVVSVPLINIFLLLLIFFVCASGDFCRLPLALNPLPAESYRGSGRAFNELIVRGEESMLLNGSPVPLERIAEKLAASFAGEKVLVIKVSGKVPVSLLAGVWNKCRRAGAERINILTER